MRRMPLIHFLLFFAMVAPGICFQGFQQRPIPKDRPISPFARSQQSARPQSLAYPRGYRPYYGCSSLIPLGTSSKAAPSETSNAQIQASLQELKNLGVAQTAEFERFTDGVKEINEALSGVHNEMKEMIADFADLKASVSQTARDDAAQIAGLHQEVDPVVKIANNNSKELEKLTPKVAALTKTVSDLSGQLEQIRKNDRRIFIAEVLLAIAIAAAALLFAFMLMSRWPKSEDGKVSPSEPLGKPGDYSFTDPPPSATPGGTQGEPGTRYNPLFNPKIDTLKDVAERLGVEKVFSVFEFDDVEGRFNCAVEFRKVRGWYVNFLDYPGKTVRWKYLHQTARKLGKLKSMPFTQQKAATSQEVAAGQ
jgi:hypothetical protein